MYNTNENESPNNQHITNLNTTNDLLGKLRNISTNTYYDKNTVLFIESMNAYQNLFNSLESNNISFLKTIDEFKSYSIINFILQRFIVYDNRLYFFNKNIASQPIAINNGMDLFYYLDIPDSFDDILIKDIFNNLKLIVSNAYKNTSIFEDSFSKNYLECMKSILPFVINFGVPNFLVTELATYLFSTTQSYIYNDFYLIDKNICFPCRWGIYFADTNHWYSRFFENKTPQNFILDPKLINNFLKYFTPKIPTILSDDNPNINVLFKSSNFSASNFMISNNDGNKNISFETNNTVNKKAYTIDSIFFESLSRLKFYSSFLLFLTEHDQRKYTTLIDLSYAITTNHYDKKLFVINVDQINNDFIINFLTLLSGGLNNIVTIKSSSDLQINYDTPTYLFNRKLNGLRTILFMIESANKITYNKITDISAGFTISATSNNLRINYKNNAVAIYINNNENIPHSLIESCASKNIDIHEITFTADACFNAENIIKEYMFSHKNNETKFEIEKYRCDMTALQMWRENEISHYISNDPSYMDCVGNYIDIGSRQAWLLYNKLNFQEWGALPLILSMIKIFPHEEASLSDVDNINTFKSPDDFLADFISTFCITTGNTEGSDADKIYRETLYENYIQYVTLLNQNSIGQNNFPKKVIHYINDDSKVKYDSKHTTEKNAKAFWGIIFNNDKFQTFIDEHIEISKADVPTNLSDSMMHDFEYSSNIINNMIQEMKRQHEELTNKKI